MLTDIMLIIIKFTGAYFLETKYSNTPFLQWLVYLSQRTKLPQKIPASSFIPSGMKWVHQDNTSASPSAGERADKPLRVLKAGCRQIFVLHDSEIYKLWERINQNLGFHFKIFYFKTACVCNGLRTYSVIVCPAVLQSV